MNECRFSASCTHGAHEPLTRLGPAQTYIPKNSSRSGGVQARAMTREGSKRHRGSPPPSRCRYLTPQPALGPRWRPRVPARRRAAAPCPPRGACLAPRATSGAQRGKCARRAGLAARPHGTGMRLQDVARRGNKWRRRQRQCEPHAVHNNKERVVCHVRELARRHKECGERMVRGWVNGLGGRENTSARARHAALTARARGANEGRAVAASGAVGVGRAVRGDQQRAPRADASAGVATGEHLTRGGVPDGKRSLESLPSTPLP